KRRGSKRDPFSTQMPTVTDGTPGMCSETMRRPFGSSERLTMGSRVRPSAGRRAGAVRFHRLLATEADLPPAVDLKHLDGDLVTLFQHVGDAVYAPRADL